MNNIGVDQSALMRRLVGASIVHKPTTCQSDLLEKRLKSSKCFNDGNKIVKL